MSYTPERYCSWILSLNSRTNTFYLSWHVSRSIIVEAACFLGIQTNLKNKSQHLIRWNCTCCPFTNIDKCYKLFSYLVFIVHKPNCYRELLVVADVTYFVCWYWKNIHQHCCNLWRYFVESALIWLKYLSFVICK